MTKIKIDLDLKNCEKCPNFDERPGEYVSPDSFEGPNFDWYCKANGKKIRGYVEWNERNKISVPDWCPCIEKEEEPIVFKLPPYKCDYCRDTGQVHYGGSFGGDIMTQICPACKNK
jgi:hypothetical protein